MTYSKSVGIIAVAILILIGGNYYLHTKNIENENTQHVYICNQDALQCPNGSYVSRDGEECTFKSCPNQESFTGILRQTQNGFDLIMGVPGTTTIEVSYSMPLVIKVSNVLADLVGKKVKVYGSFTMGNTFSVTQLEPLSGDAADATVGKVSVGDSVFINGIRVTVHSVLEDSRCPLGVQCIWAGRVRLNVTLQSDTDKETVEISTNEEPRAFDSYKISLVNVTPSAHAGEVIERGKYNFVFKVVSSN